MPRVRAWSSAVVFCCSDRGVLAKPSPSRTPRCGVTAGALSVAVLFNNCFNYFEFAQLGRSFEASVEAVMWKL